MSKRSTRLSPRRKAGAKQAKLRKRKLGTVVIKIPVTVDTLTAVMLLVQELVQLARVVKLPMQAERVASEL